MAIQQVQAYSPLAPTTGAGASRATGAYSDSGPTANASRPAEANGRSVTLSEQGKAYAASATVYPMDTGAGVKNLDLASFFTPGTHAGGDILAMDGLLMPTARNVQALQQHISSVFPGFLAANGIPAAPERIRYDDSGNLVLPADYPYADKLKAALDKDPAMARELSTANALASHLAAIQATVPFQEEAARAKSQAELDAIIDKYSYLFGDNRTYPEIALLFSDEGKLTITADSEALV